MDVVWFTLACLGAAIVGAFVGVRLHDKDRAIYRRRARADARAQGKLLWWLR